MEIRYHPPDPRVGPKCDVCWFGPAQNKLPCMPFILKGPMGPTIFGAEGIAACNPCKDDVLFGDARLPELETRLIEGLGAYGQAHFAKLKPFVHELHHHIIHSVEAARQ